MHTPSFVDPTRSIGWSNGCRRDTTYENLFVAGSVIPANAASGNLPATRTGGSRGTDGLRIRRQVCHSNTGSAGSRNIAWSKSWRPTILSSNQIRVGDQHEGGPRTWD